MGSKFDFVLAALLLVFAALVGVYDIYRIVTTAGQESVSATLYAWCQRWPILPFTVGVVIGHILWCSRR